MMKNQRGFSLIEVMVGVAILAFMSLIIYSTLNRALDAKQRIEKKDKLIHGARMTLNKMVDDFSQAFLANKSFSGKDDGYVTGMKGNADKIDFSTLGHYHYMRNAKDTDQVTVGYYLKSGEGLGSQLMRRESERLSDKFDEGGDAFPMVENVKELKFQYYDSNKDEWVGEWSTEGVSSLGRLPQAIRIDLTLVLPDDKDPERQGKEFDFSTTASVGMYLNEINF